LNPKPKEKLMAREAKFPRVEACATFIDIRHLLGNVRWQSAEYQALLEHWRELCRFNFMLLQRSGQASARDWHDLYMQCPSGSPEQKVAEALWQSSMPRDPELATYRRRLMSDALPYLPSVCGFILL